jgi:hypothetical protein
LLDDLFTCCFRRLQRDTTGLSAENAELKIRLQAMEQQAHLRDGEALCDYNSFVNLPLSTTTTTKSFSPKQVGVG